jgi:hypothetical protein
VQFAEATIAQLTSLEVVCVPDLPSPACLLGGEHTHLRVVRLASVHVAATGATFAQLAGACPSLVQADSDGLVEVDGMPGGWVATAQERRLPLVSIRRTSFA